MLGADRAEPTRGRAHRAGLTAAPVVRDLSHRLGIELPITEGVCAVLEGESLTGLVESLMRRAPTTE